MCQHRGDRLSNPEGRAVSDANRALDALFPPVYLEKNDEKPDWVMVAAVLLGPGGRRADLR